MWMIDANSTIGELAALLPQHTVVPGADPRQQPDTTLEQALRASGQSLSSTLEALHAGFDHRPVDVWRHADPTLIINHLIGRYHRRHRLELPKLQAMCATLRSRTDLDTVALRLSEIANALDELDEDLDAHMHKEEQILFPWIASGRRPAPRMPIQVMLAEHDHTDRHIAVLERLTTGFEPPDGADHAVCHLWAGLADFARALRHHILLENDALFPRVLDDTHPASP